MLEFAFFRALEHTENGTSNLYAELLSDPRLFMECICLVYKPRNGEPETGGDAAKVAAEVAWHVLRSGRGILGQSTDGSIDATKLMDWMAAVRSLAEESDRLAVTDLTVGEWLSQCRSDSDGTWPPSAIATLLDDEQHEDIRRGFSNGVFNNRGVTSRAMDEGGTQERVLAEQFRERAAKVADRYPRVAEMLGAIAKSYEHDARREDEVAELRHEGL